METVFLTEALVKSWLPQRPEAGHKGTFGKVDIIAGCEGFTGAPVLASRGAVRGGTGLVFLQVPRCVYPIIAVKCDEAMPSPLPEENGKLSSAATETVLERLNGCDAGLIGPGLGQSAGVRSVVLSVVRRCEKPLVVDADGLNALSHHILALDERAAPTVLTPHDGEFHRLAGVWPSKVQEERRCQALEFAQTHGCILVLKGHKTLIAAPDGTLYENTTGNNGMAKGGSGDVLGGLMVSLLAQGMFPVQAAAAAVWIHGKTGDLCAQAMGQRAMTPSDLIETLYQVLKPLEN